MKSIKKQFKEQLALVYQAATGLAMISEGLTHLKTTRQIAETAISAAAALKRQTSALKKNGFREGVMESEALAILEEIGDNDLLSTQEESLFAELGELDENGAGLLRQQLLDKVEKRHAELLKSIQTLISLLEA